MKYTVRESQLDDEIVIIRINRPEGLNALDKEVAAELYAAFFALWTELEVIL